MLYLTTTLLNSYDYHKDKENQENLFKTIRKEPIEITEAIQKGWEFEALVEKLATGGNIEVNLETEELEALFEIARECKGGAFQVSCDTTIKTAKGEFKLIGKIDVLKKKLIQDMKTTGRYEMGKFRSSVQHIIYMLSTGIQQFDYLINCNGNFWKETYFWHDGMKEELEQKIINFITYLEQNPELYNAYITKWNWRV
jgi:hypothetical protein